MSRTTKPYRRYRARGSDGEGDGLRELRALTERAAGGGAAPPSARPQRPERPPRPGRLEARQRRALRREQRRWWSFADLGPAGWAGRVALLLLVAIIAWAGFGWLALNGAVGEANGKINPSALKALDTPTGGLLGTPTNTLILGPDVRTGETRGRADTILIMRTDPDSGRIKYLSIPRDWRIDLPGHGTQKINAAFYFGGQEAMIKAVKRVTGLPINHLIVIKFTGFPKMIDALGGITVTNPTALVNCPYPGGTTVSFPAGRIHLDGARALQFSRVRKCDGDFERALRQQAVLAGMKSKILSVGSLWRAPWRGAALVRTLQTDLSTTDLIKMGWLQARLKQDKADRILLTGTPEEIGGIDYVVQTDPDLNERQIASFISSK
jgi:polyisoprenyl-teichoic acid--peptidoglycan teichoic acid transferase